ncbi:hypothetical protein FGE12_08705 [Aggregicoccus sp. 17bor-14]|uniref:hypothetical protein n=1 Tax=Myxococcaceae TaxID=31 RepID=UPI00129C3BDB|nr:MULTISPECIES: hypothetical protein [Myxococcaceae]MBF5042479.1 hypothetical protein [Simulacricoccus sp. 17bor-14]MRI88250.1 hypothetical protein [Aggregicoccus sp. 17bor-14]
MLRSPPTRSLALALLPGLLLSGCIQDNTGPGDAVLGTFTFEARLLPDSGCPAGDLPADGGLSFDAVLTRRANDAGTSLLVNGVAREAGYDGQTLHSVTRALAPGFARTCNSGCVVEAQETLQLVVLSQKQQELYGRTRSCADLLDGGVPTDGGASPPGLDPATFDAVRACGAFTTLKLPDAGCTCAQCSIDFAVEGSPKVAQ